MKMIRLFAVTLFITALFAVSSFAQATSSQPVGAGRIVVINTYAFGAEKEGINKYVAAINALNIEFKPVDDELKTLNTKLQGLATEIENLKKLMATNPKAVDERSANAKVDEAEKLQRDIKFKSEDAKARYEKRQNAVLGPVLQDIYKAVAEYQKQKGYMMILDIGKMADADIIMALDEKADVTKEFITYYNARPAGTATAAAPK